MKSDGTYTPAEVRALVDFHRRHAPAFVCEGCGRPADAPVHRDDSDDGHLYVPSHAELNQDAPATPPADPAPEPVPSLDDDALLAIIERNAVVTRAEALATQTDWEQFGAGIYSVKQPRPMRSLLRACEHNSNFANDMAYAVAVRNARQHRDVDALLARLADRAHDLQWQAEHASHTITMINEDRAALRRENNDLRERLLALASEVQATPSKSLPATPHTAGPWSHDDEGYVYGADGEQVAGVYEGDGRVYDEVEANTRLITAAPDLLDACRKLLDSDAPGVDPSGYIWTLAVSAARAAVRQTTE
jgi:hypothetical protein